MDYERWIGRETHHMKVENLENHTAGESPQCGYVTENPAQSNLGPNAPVIKVMTSRSLNQSIRPNRLRRAYVTH